MFRLCSASSGLVGTYDLRQNILDIKCMFHFSLQRLFETFFARINI
jgi:hypothetical protein